MMKDEPMKLPKPAPRPLDDLLVHDSLSMSLRHKGKFPERLVRLIITLCGSIGTVCCMQGFFHFPIDLRPMVLFIIGFTLLMRAVRGLLPKLGFACILSAFACIPLVLLRYREAAVVGSGAVYRTMRRIILWQAVFENPTVHAGKWTEPDCIRFIFDLLVIALVALLEYSDVLMTHPQSSRSGFWIRFLVTFPFLESGLYFGLETYSWAVFLIVFFWIGTLSVARRRQTKRLAIEQGNSYRLQHAFTSEVYRRFTTHETGAAVLIVGVLALAAASLIGTARYERSEKMLQARRDLRDWYQNFTLRDITGLLQKIPTDFGVNVISEELDLRQQDDLHFDGSPALQISAGGALDPDDYYLRGIVRSVYTGSGWATPNGVYRRHQKLFEDLAAADRMPQMLYHSGHVDELRMEDGRLPVVEMDITALHPEVVSYIPYQALIRSGSRFRNDTETEVGSYREYAFWVVNNAKVDWKKFSAETSPSDNELIGKYEEFVEDTYLALPETESMRRVYDAFRNSMPNPQSPLNEQLETIRRYIWERADYTLHPGPMPEGVDYVEYFLSEGHKGYCAHYASSAVVLCRMAGIPARYVQGYVIGRGNFAGARDGEYYNLLVPDYQAHAWAEIYVKGYGWIPFEFTEDVVDSWHVPANPDAEQTEPAPVSTASPVTTTTTTAAAPPSSQEHSDTDVQDSKTSAAETTATVPELPVIGGLSPETVRLLRNLLIAVTLAAAVIVLWLIVHVVIVRRRQKTMHHKDPNRAADASFAFLMQLLHGMHIEQEKRTYEEFASYAEMQSALIPKGAIRRAVAVQQAVVFSRDGVSEKEAAKIRKTAEELAKAVYADASFPKRLILRWFRHIVF